METQNITLTLDTKTVNYLLQDVKSKRTAGRATSFGDIFLIRLTEALNNKQASLVLKIKENKSVIRDHSKLK